MLKPPILLDADALTFLAQKNLGALNKNFVLTPHLVGVLNRAIENTMISIDLDTLKYFIKAGSVLCEDNVQKCFQSLRKSFETNTQEVKNGKDSFNISQHLKAIGDLTRAKWWLEKAALQGLAPAQFNLAEMYDAGDGGTQDRPLAREWYEKAAQQGFAPAQYHLALMYYQGKGGAQDLQLAKSWLEKAAQQGYARAQYNLAEMYDTGKGWAQDLQLARYWYEKAAQQGHTIAQFNLAEMYDKGIGGAQDLQLAREWYKKAAQQDYPAATYRLALTYLKGARYTVQQGFAPAKETWKKLFKNKKKQTTSALTKCLKIFRGNK